MKSRLRLVLWLGLLGMLTACSQEDTRSVTVVGYNYTERPVHLFSVNGSGGGNAFAGYRSGGGGMVCCATVTVGKPAVIDWMYSRTKKQYEMGVQKESRSLTVTVPPPQVPDAAYLEVHFFPDHHVELALVKFPGPGRWPAGTKMETLE